MYQLFNGDCLEIMPTLPAQSVDAIITDLPYGSTSCAWDSVIPFDDMWACVKHVLKPNGAFVTTASQPFTSLLVCSNLKWFKYCWIWDKDIAGAFALAKFRPMIVHEDICVFGDVRTNYYPIMNNAQKKNIRPVNKGSSNSLAIFSRGTPRSSPDYNNHERYPKSIISYSKYGAECNQLNRTHPTQKPVALYAYLIRTYTNPGDVVLDMCFGSNTTGVACIETGRQYIGIEKDRKYFELGQRRIEQAQPPLFVEDRAPANNRLHTTGKGGEQNWLFN